MDAIYLCFYCFTVLEEKATTCPACGAETFEITPEGRRPTGRQLGALVPGESGPKGPRFSLGTPNLPKRVDLRPGCSAVEDQGKVGSCAANAAVGAFEYQLRKEGRAALELSRLFVYYNGRRIGNVLDHDKGLMIAWAMAALAAQGAPEEKHWPYIPEKWNHKPTQEAYDLGWKVRPRQYACVEGGEGMRGALARGFPVVVGLRMAAQCYHDAARSGVIRQPTADEDRGPQYGHALLIVGYDLDTQEYILRNSWGTNWGDQGYCRASFSVIEKYGDKEEFWILGNLEQAADADAPKELFAAPPAPEPSTVVGLAGKLRDDIRTSLTKDLGDAAKEIKDRMKPRP